MKILTILLCLIASSLQLSIAAQSKKLNKNGKYEYSKKEFNDAVYAELAKKMKKIGRSRLLDFGKELLQKEESLDARDLVIKRKEEQIGFNEEELKQKIIEFKLTQESFLSCLDKEDKEVNKRIGHMVDVVSGMRPQTAANLLSQQDPSISVKIMGMLDPTKVSKIFNLMDKEISAKLQKQYMTLKK